MGGRISRGRPAQPHTDTVTENDGIFAAKFPLQCQHDNERSDQQGSPHRVKPSFAEYVKSMAGAIRWRRARSSSNLGRARRAASAPAAQASATRSEEHTSELQ